MGVNIIRGSHCLIGLGVRLVKLQRENEAAIGQKRERCGPVEKTRDFYCVTSRLNKRMFLSSLHIPSSV
jgi:hypothetical protein